MRAKRVRALGNESRSRDGTKLWDAALLAGVGVQLESLRRLTFKRFRLKMHLDTLEETLTSVWFSFSL